MPHQNHDCIVKLNLVHKSWFFEHVVIVVIHFLTHFWRFFSCSFGIMRSATCTQRKNFQCRPEIVVQTTYLVQAHLVMLRPAIILSINGVDCVAQLHWLCHRVLCCLTDRQMRCSIDSLSVRWSHCRSPGCTRVSMPFSMLRWQHYHTHTHTHIQYSLLHSSVISYFCQSSLTSAWPHLRCDVGLEEGEYRENCLCLSVLCTIIMVHKDTSSSYGSVNCIGLWSCVV